MKRIETKINKAPKLSRRSFLGGTGVCISLPLLEAMLPTGKTAFAQSASPTRMITVFTGNGIHMQTWTPNATGRNYTLPETLEPLAPLKNDMLVLTGIENAPAKPNGVGDHGAGSGGFLTCSSVRRSTSDLLAAVSMDQVAAQRIGGATRFASLQLGINAGGGIGGNCDNNFSCAYLRNISWSTPKTPMPKISDPRQAFDRLFSDLSDSGSNAEIQRLATLNKSVIDNVLEDANRLEAQLGSNDRAKLQEYLNSIRELEEQLEMEPSAGSCNPPVRPGSNLNYQEKSRAMNDIMVMAFQCDQTRIISHMLSNGLSGQRYSHLGIGNGHHSISHHGSRQSNYDQLKKIDKYHMEELSYLAQKLKATTDIQGKSLLDSTVIYYSSEISDGNRHNHDNLPILLIGSANGYFDTGRHIRYSGRPPLANLYTSMLEAVGAPVDRFGDNGTGKLGDLS